MTISDDEEYLSSDPLSETMKAPVGLEPAYTPGKRRCCLLTSIILMTVGALAVVIGIVCLVVLPSYVSEQVRSKVVIDSTEHSEFYTIKSNTYDGAAAKYNKMYFYDIQNPSEFLSNNAKPKFVERGPYVFREYYSRNNFNFSQDGTLMSYSDTVQQQFVPELSNGSLDDILNIVNLPYVKVMSAVGGEKNVMAATGPKVFVMTINAFKEQMVPAVKAAAAATAIKTAVDKLGFLNGGKEWLISKMGGSCPRNDCTFITTPFGRKYRIFLNTTLCSCLDCGCEADIISKEQMMFMMNETDPYSFMNTEQDKGVNYWLPWSTYYADSYKKMLMEYYGLTDRQFNKLQGWLSNAANSDIVRDGVFKELKGTFAVNSWDDLVYRQWIAGDVIGTLQKLENKVVSLNPALPPEFPFAQEWIEKTGQADKLASMPWSLQGVDCIYQILRSNESWAMEYFFNLSIQRPGKAELFIKPSLDVVPTDMTFEKCWTAEQLGNQGALDLLRVYFDYITNNLAYPQFKEVADKAGLVIRRSVREIVLGAPEPLLQLVLEPSDPRFGQSSYLKHDEDLSGPSMCHASIDVENDFTSCRLIRTLAANGTMLKTYERSPSVYYTGSNDSSLVNQYKALNGYTTIENVFLNNDMKIDGGAKDILGSVQYGFSDGMTFPPLNTVNKDSKVSILVTPFTASLTFKYEGNTNDLHGLDLMRFRVESSQFSPSRSDAALFDMTFSDTPAGVLNITEPRNFRVFASLPHFLGYEQNFEAFDGIGAADKNLHDSYLDIEPITGKAMRVAIRAQVVASTTSADYSVFFPNVYKAEYLPVYWQEITGEASPQQAALVTGQVYTGYFLGSTGAIISISVGAALLIIGIALYVVKVRRNRKI